MDKYTLTTEHYFVSSCLELLYIIIINLIFSLLSQLKYKTM